MKPHRQDKALRRRLLRGDETAFRQFFEDQYPVAYRFSLRRLPGNVTAAEEIAQATICRALEKISAYRGEAALMTWTLSICRREISNWHRRQGRFAAEVELSGSEAELSAALESLVMQADDPERSAMRTQVRDRVQQALDNLRPNHRRALRWKYLEGRTVREIAARLELSEKAAESTLTRARAGFKEAFLLLSADTASSHTEGSGVLSGEAVQQEAGG